MGLIFDINNGNNWVSRYSNSLQGTPAKIPGNFEDILPQEIPVTFTNQLIAISADSNQKKDSWFTAGSLFQRTAINIGNGSNGFNAIVPKSYKFYFNQFTIIPIPKLSENYALTLTFPSWIKQIEFEIYEYIGEIIDTTELKLDQMQADLEACLNNSDNNNGNSGVTLTTQQKAAITYFTNFL